MRHGLSEANKHMLTWSGDTDTPLAPEGIEQAIRAGQKAKEEGLTFDVIICSPLSRAHDTAKLFAKEIGYPEDKILIDKNLLERSFGIFEGRRDLIAHTKYIFSESAIDDYEGVEKLDTLQDRADKYLKYVKSLPHDNILIVGHGGFGRAFRRSVNSDDITHRGESIKNAELLKYI